MNRFMGLMPPSEVERSEVFKDQHGMRITIDAGPHGWTIIFADNSTEYKDVDQDTNKNFFEAYNHLIDKGFGLTSTKPYNAYKEPDTSVEDDYDLGVFTSHLHSKL